jgi:hypothetical protein
MMDVDVDGDACLRALYSRHGIKSADLIGFSGRNWVSAGINIATYGIPFVGISHVGIMAHADDGRLLLFESTTMDPLPCEIRGRTFEGTQAHRLDEVLRLYRGRVYHYPFYRLLYGHEDERLTRFLMDTIGTPYDLMGAFRSAGVGLSWVESLFRGQDLTSIFCSESVAAAYSTVGVFAAGNVSRWSPNKLIRRCRRDGILREPKRLRCGVS